MASTYDNKTNTYSGTDGGGHARKRLAPDWSWVAFVLPHMEQSAIYQGLGVQSRDAMDAVVDPNVRALMGTPVSSFLCPSDAKPSPTADRAIKIGATPKAPATSSNTLADANDNGYNNVVALQNYVGNMERGRDALTSSNADRWFQMNVGLWTEGPFNANSRVPLIKIGDGTTNTILLGERAWSYTAGGKEQISSAAAMYVTVCTKGPSEANGASHALAIGGHGINYPYNDRFKSAGIFFTSLRRWGKLCPLRRLGPLHQ